jgi:ADP-heptose:LPS heptosyltransferase
MRILIIKPSSFGDIVHASPCATALKKVYPGCEISWVVFNQWADFLELLPDVDKIITWDRCAGAKGFFKVLKEVRKNEYDLIFDLQGLFRSGLLAKLACGKVKIGAPGMKELSGFMIKEAFPEKAGINATLRNLEAVNFISGQKFEPQINISISETDLQKARALLKDAAVSGDYITLLPFARGHGKDWSVENYLKLIDLIKEKYGSAQILVLGTQKDYGRINSAKITDLCGKTDIKLLAALLSKSALSIGADTGSMHLSSVLNVPSIFIFGVSDINETSPYIGRFSLFVNRDNPKDINSVSPRQIFSEVQKWIK